MKFFVVSNWLLISCFLLELFICSTAMAQRDEQQTEFDVVIAGGRVIDPASGTDSVRNIGIKDGEIAAISEEKLEGKKRINAVGKIVSPGFIDLHTHSPFPLGEDFQIKDGCTTALDLEAGAFPVSAYGRFLREGARANFGCSVGHYAIRVKVIEGKDQPYIVTELGGMVPGAAFRQQATPKQIEQMRELLNLGVDDGGLGIGFLLDYMSPAISDEELRMIFEVAAKRDVVVWAHIRRGSNGDIKPLLDLLEIAAETDAKLHICHINANAMGAIDKWLEAIDQANLQGADITAEVFPYTAGSTSISADVFNRNWQEVFGISYEDIQWSETGEYFTRETWEEKRTNRPDGMIIHHYMKEDWLKVGLKHPCTHPKKIAALSWRKSRVKGLLHHEVAVGSR
jgi:N-acyl-D-aspartate/D-glutamate deacylase